MKTMREATETTSLEVPLLDERPWAVFAACTEAKDVSFFPQSKAEERSALAVCSFCPVQEDCLDHALETRERFGVWGGVSEKERRKISRIA